METQQTVSQGPEEILAARFLSEAAPEILGYSITEKIGTGSFGTVYRAVQQRTGQLVAIKVLRLEVAQCDYFQHEMNKLSQIAEHPHVVTLLDANIQNRPPYYVMPLLEEGSLEQQSPSGDWVGRVTAWMAEIAEALQHMHGKGLLHCDLKPSNVLLDSRGASRLVDFGQARKVGDNSAAFGTLGYMPPEQACLDAQPDSRWDVYAWGATTYRLLGGQCPRFGPEDRTELTKTTDISERLQQYRDWISQRPLIPLRKLNPRVDEDLAHIVESTLILEPSLRTSSIAQILHDLERRREGDPLLCRRPWTSRYKLVRFLSRPAIALSILASLAVPMFVNTYLTIKANSALKRQVLREAQLVNRLTARQLRQQPDWQTIRPRLPAGQEYHHYLVTESRAGPGDPPVDLGAMEAESGSPTGGYYHRQGILQAGAWSKLGPWTLVSEREATLALEDANDILNKNLLLNGLILATAAGTALLIVRFTRR